MHDFNILTLFSYLNAVMFSLFFFLSSSGCSVPWLYSQPQCILLLKLTNCLSISVFIVEFRMNYGSRNKFQKPKKSKVIYCLLIMSYWQSGDKVHLVTCLLSIDKALTSIPSTAQTWYVGTGLQSQHLGSENRKIGVQGHPWLMCQVYFFCPQ